MKSNHTIIALSTAPGGAIAIIRLSGKNAIEVCEDIFISKNSIKEAIPNTVHYGKIIDENGEIVDEVLLTAFKAPKSYTGENMVEISCHGSSYIIQRILDLFINKGCQLAQAGEFTQRAFLNGKMDLVQAEAVADIIASESKVAHTIAMNQLRGGVSTELAVLRESLINFTALIELELDFGEEDVEFANREELFELVQNLKSKIQKLIDSFRYGNAIKQGVPVAIVGAPNVGKSTLLNALLNEDRAIVSDIEGTTRDTIEEVLNIEGIQFRFIDTAGIRSTIDTIESIGIERSIQAMEQADIILYLIDGSKPFSELDFMNKMEEYANKCIFIANKLDQTSEEQRHSLSSRFLYHFISAKNDIGIEELKQILLNKIKGTINVQQQIVSNARHYDELKKSFVALDQVELGMRQNLSGDLLAFHLRDALKHIGEITGNIDIDRDILGTIFGKFCIGK